MNCDDERFVTRCHEILHAIRKNGVYIAEEKITIINSYGYEREEMNANYKPSPMCQKEKVIKCIIEE